MVEMDFLSMKRKQLQALCKKHKMPANLSNKEMADKLTEFLKEKENPLIQRSVKGHDVNVVKSESADVNVNRKVKKVKFSPENELFEFTRSPLMKKRNSRNSILCGDSTLSLENVDNSETKNEMLGGLGRSTRSRGLKPIEDQVNVKKRGRNAVKCDKNTAIEVFDDDKLKEGHVDSSARVMMLRGRMLEVNVESGSKIEMKRVKDVKKDEKATDHDAIEKTTQEIVDIPCRVTRSRMQELTEVHAKVQKRGRKVAARVANAVLDETEENRVAGEGKLARDSGESVEHNGKGEMLENKNIAEERRVTGPQISTRTSKRNADIVSDSEMLNVDTKKHENGNQGLMKTTKMASDGSGGSGETGNHVNLRGRAVRSTEEPIRMEPKRSNRRKNVIDNLIAETENRDTLKSSVPHVEKNVVRPSVAMRRSRRKTLSLKSVSADEDIINGLAVENPESEIVNRFLLRSSVSQLEIACGASKEEKIPQPTGVLRRSRRKTLNVTVASADEKIDNDAAVENLEVENNKDEPVENECSAIQKNTRRSRRIASNAKSRGSLDEVAGDSVIHQKNTAMKRKRGVISVGDVVKTQNDPCSAVVTMKEGSSGKGVPAAETGKVADSKKRTRPNDFKLFDASSHNGVERGELSHTSAKPSASEVLGSTSNLDIRIDPVPQNIISDMGLTSARKTNKKNPDISITDGAGSSYNGKELSNKNSKAPSRIEEMKTDFTYSEGQTSVMSGMENGNSHLGIDVNELIEQYIAATNENENMPEAHDLSQTEDIGNQVLPDDLNEGFYETGSSTDNPLIGDQSDDNADKEVSEAKLDKCLQPSPCMVDNVDKDIVLSAQENLDPDGTRKDSQLPSENSNISEKKDFAENAASPDSLILGDQSDIKEDVKVTEVEADIGSQPNAIIVGHISKVNIISAQENLDSDDTIQDNQALLEDSIASRKEVLAETGSSAGSHLQSVDQTDIRTDLEVVDVEADTDLQPNSCMLDHVGEAYVITAQENLDSDGTRQGDLVLPERSHVIGKEDFAEIVSSAGSPFLVDQIDITTDLEVTKAEAIECLETSPIVVEDVGEVKVISVQNNVEPDGARLDNQCIGETGFFAKSLLLGNQTDIGADLEVVEAEADIFLQPNLSGADYTGEVPRVCVQENMEYNARKEHNHVLPDGSFVSGNGGFAEFGSTAERLKVGEVKNAEGDKCLQSSHNVDDHVSEVKIISVQENLDSGKARHFNDITSAPCPFIDEDHLEASRNILDNNNNLDRSPQARVDGDFESSEGHIDYSQAKSTFGLEALSSGMLRSLEGENLAEGNKAFRNDIAPELAESSNDELLNIHESASYEYYGVGVSYLSDGEGSARIGPQDRVVFSGDRSVVNSDEQGKYEDSVAVAFMTNSSEIPQIRDHKTDRTPKREETNNDQSSNLEDGKSVEIGGHWSKGDEDEVISVYNLFDAEERSGIMPRGKEIISSEQYIKEFDDQGMVHGSPSVAPTTMCDFARELEADLIAEGIEAHICNVKQSELIDVDESGCYKKNNKSSKDEDCTFNISHLFDGENSSWITTPDEKVTFPDFPSASTTSANDNEIKMSADSSSLQEISSSKPIGVSESQGEQSKSPLAEPTSIAKTTKIQKAWSNASETAGHDMCLLEADTSEVVKGSSTDEDANYANCGKDKEDFSKAYITDVKVSMDCTISKIEVESLAVADVKSQETDESVPQQNKELPARQIEPTVGEEHTDSIQSWTGNELHNLFTSSIQEISPSKSNSVSESQGEQSKSPSAEPTSIAKTKECLNTMKANVVTENGSDEKEECAGCELEKGLYLEDPLSDDIEDGAHNRLTEVDNVDGKSSKEQLTDEEVNIVPLGESYLFVEAPDGGEKNSTSLSDSPRNSDKPEVCPGIEVKLDSKKQNESEYGHGYELQKNARSILIHGTPGKLLRVADMKENVGICKNSNVGDLTTVRTAKRRRALQDVPWK